MERAAQIALAAAKAFLQQDKNLQQIILVCFNEFSYQCHFDALEKLAPV